MKGLFISFEGPEGVGKSTQIKLLTEKLEAMDKEVVLTREPGGTRLGEAVRNILQHDAAGDVVSDHAELLLFAACRAQLVDTLIRPAIDEGKVVLCDRFYDSTMAYQGYGRGLDKDAINSLRDLAVQDVHPNLTFLMDMPIEVAMQRARARSANGNLDRIERESMEFHGKVAEGFRAIAAEHNDRFVCINAEASIDHNASQIWSAVRDRLS